MKCKTTKHTNVKRYTEEFPDVEKISTEVVSAFEVAKGIELSNNTNVTTTANHTILDENTELVHINSVAHSSESLAVENLLIKYDRKSKAVKEKTHEICGKTPPLTRLSSTKFKEINGVNKVVFIGTNDRSKFYEYDDKGRLIEETIENHYKESNEPPTAPKTEKTSYRYPSSGGGVRHIEKHTIAVNGQCKASFLDNFIEDYEYDDKNNLIKVIKTCVPITDGGIRVIKTGAYDHKNRLVQKTSSVLRNGHRDSDIVVHITYDDDRVIKMVSVDKTYKPDGSVRNTVTCQMDVHYVTHSDDTVTETRKLVYYNETMDKNMPRTPVIITTKYRPGAPLSKTFNKSLLVTIEGFSGTIYNDSHEIQSYIISQTESTDNDDTFTLNKRNTFSDDGKLIEGKTDRETFSESFKYEYNNSNSDKPTMIEYSEKTSLFEMTTKTEYEFTDGDDLLISKFVTSTLNDESSEEYALDKVMSNIQSVSKEHIKEIVSSLGLRFDDDKITM